MKNKFLNLIILLLSILSLIISLRLFSNMAVFADEYNTSPSAICGGDFWLWMDWFRLAISGVVCILAGWELIKKH